jgi:phenylalanyl-tRNA synthetase beta chain
MANSLTSPEYAKLSEMLKEEHNVLMMNPLSNELAAMRQSLLFSGLEAVSYNINRRNPDLKLFEFGKTYHRIEDEYREHKHLTLFISGSRVKESWSKPQKNTDFFLFKGYVNAVLSRLGIEKVQNQPATNDIFAEGIAISNGHETLVELGTVKKSILKHFDIKQEVLYADFNWHLILKLIANKIKFTELPRYPEVRRDLALLVDEEITFDSIYKVARQSEKSLLKDINLFDVYSGNNLPEGKKSYAISFIIQDNSKTLTDSQIDKIMSKLAQNLESELGAVLR